MINNIQKKIEIEEEEKQMLKAGRKQMKQSFIGLGKKLNFKKYVKREKAITLIALVITIIVLLMY